MNGFTSYYMGSSSIGANVTTYIRPHSPIEARVFAARYDACSGYGGNVVEMSEFGTVGRRWPRREILAVEAICRAVASLGDAS